MSNLAASDIARECAMKLMEEEYARFQLDFATMTERANKLRSELEHLEEALRETRADMEEFRRK